MIGYDIAIWIVLAVAVIEIGIRWLRKVHSRRVTKNNSSW